MKQMNEALLFWGNLLLNCLLAFGLQPVYIYVITLTLPICNPLPLGNPSCTNKRFQKCKVCDSKAAAVLLSPVLSASGMKSGGMWYKTERKWSHRALILEQTCVCYSDAEPSCVSAGPGQGFMCCLGSFLEQNGAKNALLVRALLVCLPTGLGRCRVAADGSSEWVSYFVNVFSFLCLNYILEKMSLCGIACLFVLQELWFKPAKRLGDHGQGSMRFIGRKHFKYVNNSFALKLRLYFLLFVFLVLFPVSVCHANKHAVYKALVTDHIRKYFVLGSG